MAKAIKKTLYELYSGVKKENLKNLYYEKFENKDSAIYQKIQDEVDYLTEDFKKLAIREFINSIEKDKNFNLSDEWLTDLAKKTYSNWIPPKNIRDWVQEKIIEFIEEGIKNEK